MHFNLKDLRNNQQRTISEQQMKELIINKTISRYERGHVTEERTGQRFEELQGLVAMLDYPVCSNIYIVTAIARVNSNPMNRYLILVDGACEDNSIAELFKEHIPIYSVVIDSDEQRGHGECSILSTWFRQNMGSAFSFSDVDYLIYNRHNRRALILEEKAGSPNTLKIGYGQLLSYGELLNDVMEYDSSIMFVYKNGRSLWSFECDGDAIDEPNRNRYFNSVYPGFAVKQEVITVCNPRSLLSKINEILG